MRGGLFLRRLIPKYRRDVKKKKQLLYLYKYLYELRIYIYRRDSIYALRQYTRAITIYKQKCVLISELLDKQMCHIPPGPGASLCGERQQTSPTRSRD